MIFELFTIAHVRYFETGQIMTKKSVAIMLEGCCGGNVADSRPPHVDWAFMTPSENMFAFRWFGHVLHSFPCSFFPHVPQVQNMMDGSHNQSRLQPLFHVHYTGLWPQTMGTLVRSKHI